MMMSEAVTAKYRERLPKLETVDVNTDLHYLLDDNPLAYPGIVGAGLGAVAAIVLGGLLPPALQRLVKIYTVTIAATTPPPLRAPWPIPGDAATGARPRQTMHHGGG